MAAFASCGARQSRHDAIHHEALSDCIDEARGEIALAAVAAANASVIDDAEIDIRFGLFGELAAANEYDAALAHIAVLRRARPGWHSFRYEEARMLLFGRADAAGALTAADGCLDVRPDHAGCLEMRGRALLDLGRRDDAIEALVHALNFEPGRADAAEILARAYMQSDRNVEAIDVIENVINQRGRSVNLLLVRATALERLGEHGRAESDFVAIANSHPDPVAGWSYLAAYYRRAERAEDLARIEQMIAGFRRGRPL